MKYKNYRLSALLMAMCLLTGCASEKTLNDEVAAEQSTPSNTQTKEEQTTGSAEEKKDDDIEIEGSVVSSAKIDLSAYTDPVKITKGGTFTISGKGSTLIVDAPKQDVTLVLDNVTLENGSLPALFVKKAGSVTIQLKGDNTLTMGSIPTYEPLDAALYSKADLMLEGNGSLSVTSGYEHGIKAKDTLVAKSGTYTIQAQNDGIHVNGTADFEGGNYTISCKGEGMEAKDSMTINGGTYTIHAADDGINAINALTINSGTIMVISDSNDGIDSNGALIINGGTITAIGAKTPETAFDTDNTPFEINGGKILGIGSIGTYPTSAKQPVLMIGISQTVTSVEIKKDGNSVASWDSIPAYTGNGSCLYLSDPNLKQGETYEIYINGSKLSDVELTDSVTTVGNIQTMGGPGGGMPGVRPDGSFKPGGDFTPGEDFDPSQNPVPGEDFDPSQRPDGSQGFPGKGNRPQRPDGMGKTDTQSGNQN